MTSTRGRWAAAALICGVFGAGAAVAIALWHPTAAILGCWVGAFGAVLAVVGTVTALVEEEPPAGHQVYCRAAAGLREVR